MKYNESKGTCVNDEGKRTKVNTRKGRDYGTGEQTTRWMSEQFWVNFTIEELCWEGREESYLCSRHDD